MERDLKAELQVRDFYDSAGWSESDGGASTDASLWEDLREAAKYYVVACRKKILQQIPSSGQKILDAASGPIQYPEYLEYSANFGKRVCVDISQKALTLAEKKLGAKGEYVRASILELPFPENSFDCSLSLHTIYHIAKEQQAAAVRQLIRVTKPGSPLIIIYANPRRLTSRLKNLLLRKQAPEACSGVIYYFAHPLEWWQQFQDVCDLEILPWRSLTAQDSKTLIPGNIFGKLIFAMVLAMENLVPNLAVRFGAYPMVVLRKKAPAGSSRS